MRSSMGHVPPPTVCTTMWTAMSLPTLQGLLHLDLCHTLDHPLKRLHEWSLKSFRALGLQHFSSGATIVCFRTGGILYFSRHSIKMHWIIPPKCSAQVLSTVSWICSGSGLFLLWVYLRNLTPNLMLTSKLLREDLVICLKLPIKIMLTKSQAERSLQELKP